MKRMLITLVAAFMLGATATMAQTAQIALQHNGNITLFSASHMTEAMENAVDGDTLFLNEGTFEGDITIKKKLSIIGSGENTVIPGSINIAIPDSVMLDNYLLDALWITNRIVVDSCVNGIKIRKCQFYGMDFNAKIDKAFIERCYCKEKINLNDNVLGLSVYNSKIWIVNGSAKTTSSATFTNCNIRQLIRIWEHHDGWRWNHQRASFQNCIIQDWDEGLDGYYKAASYMNCLFGQNYYQSNPNQNCYLYTKEEGDTNLLNDSIECKFTTDELTDKGYLGTDGTVVGIYGGPMPYTLSPSIPRVTEHKIVVDAENKKLNVTLKVSAK